MALLEAHDALAFEAERSHAEIAAGIHEGFPDMQAVARGHVQFERQLAGEADAPHEAADHARHRGFSDGHIRECLSVEVDALADPAHQFPRLGPGHVDAGVRRGDRVTCTCQSGRSVWSQFSTHSQTPPAPELVVDIM